MEPTSSSNSPAVRSLGERSDKIAVLKILVLAVVSFLLGFALVILFLKPGTQAELPEPNKEASPTPAPTQVAAPALAATIEQPASPAASAPGSQSGYAPPPLPGEAAAPQALVAAAAPVQPAAANGAPAVPLAAAAAPDEPMVGQTARNEGDAPAELPPGKTPQGVAMDGSLFYRKCWDAEGKELGGEACGRLPILEKRVSSRLYVVHKCVLKYGGEKAKGKVSIGAEIDFNKLSSSFWTGASTDLENTQSIGTCLRSELKGFPLGNIDHKYNRYRVFFTVLFGGATGGGPRSTPGAEPETKVGAKDKPEDAAAKLKPDATASKPMPRKGRSVDVIKDKVRVRKTPDTGEVIGKISSGNKVQLIEKKAGWCHIVTPNQNDGWMVCDALAL